MATKWLVGQQNCIICFHALWDICCQNQARSQGHQYQYRFLLHTERVQFFFNYTNPGNSGILKFLINELEASERVGQRVWIIGHVPSGGGSSTNNHTALFSSIVKRFSPATIAGFSTATRTRIHSSSITTTRLQTLPSRTQPTSITMPLLM